MIVIYGVKAYDGIIGIIARKFISSLLSFYILQKGGDCRMTEKQRRFCDEYLRDCNAAQAAIRAGYSKKTAKQIGQKLLTKIDLRAYVDAQLEKIRSEKIADAQEVMEYLTSVMRGEHTEQTLQLAGDGVQQISEIKVAARERLKAAELLGKRYALFTEKIEGDIDGKLHITVDYGDS